MLPANTKVGDVIPGLLPSVYTPDFSTPQKKRMHERMEKPPRRAVVEYIHPERRYATVRFEYDGGAAFRESVDLERAPQ